MIILLEKNEKRGKVRERERERWKEREGLKKKERKRKRGKEKLQFQEENVYILIFLTPIEKVKVGNFSSITRYLYLSIDLKQFTFRGKCFDMLLIHISTFEFHKLPSISYTQHIFLYVCIYKYILSLIMVISKKHPCFRCTQPY